MTSLKRRYNSPEFLLVFLVGAYFLAVIFADVRKLKTLFIPLKPVPAVSFDAYMKVPINASILREVEELCKAAPPRQVAMAWKDFGRSMISAREEQPYPFMMFENLVWTLNNPVRFRPGRPHDQEFWLRFLQDPIEDGWILEASTKQLGLYRRTGS
jgi:hypothetical protein